MRVADAFEMYRSNLEITKREHARATARWRQVCTGLGDAFEVEDTFLIGSYARHTMPRPLRDVDILCVLTASTGQVERYRTAHPGEVLAAFCGELQLRYPHCELGVARRAVAVVLGSGHDAMCFDIVPAFERGAGGYEIPDLHLGYWVAADPMHHAKLAAEKDQECDGRWKPLIRMIKSWNRYVGEPVRPPFLIEVMGLDLVRGDCDAYPMEMGEFFAKAASRVTEDWPDPAGLAPDVNDVVMPEERAVAASALRKAHEAATRAQSLEDEGLESEAILAWRDLLGPSFPVGQFGAWWTAA
jgi:hypothetical protein